MDQSKRQRDNKEYKQIRLTELLRGHDGVGPAEHLVHVGEVEGAGQQVVDGSRGRVGRRLVVALPVRQGLEQDEEARRRG